MRYPWLYVGAKVLVARINPGGWKKAVNNWSSPGPQDGDIVSVTEVRAGHYLDLVIGIEGWPGLVFDARDFRPVLPDTTHIIEQLKASLPKRGRVDA